MEIYESYKCEDMTECGKTETGVRMEDENNADA